MTEKPYDILRWFSIFGLVGIVLYSGMLSLLQARILTEQMVKTDVTSSKEIIEGFVRAESIGLYLADPGKLGAEAKLRSFYDYLSNMPNLLRTNVFSADGKMIWSTNETLIDMDLGPNPDLKQALAGHTLFEMKLMGDKAEHVAFQPGEYKLEFIEAYIPITGGADNATVAVVELYQRTDSLYAGIETGEKIIWISTFGGSLLLYMTLIWVIRRASGTIRAQQARLAESETIAAVGELAAVVAHGIRNPLASIRTSAELALGDNREDARECAADIIAESDRMDRWVRDLLLHSRSGGLPDSGANETVNMNQLVRDNLRGFAVAMERRGISLVVDTQEPLPPAAGGAIALEQVFNSIVGNALDAMPNGGRLDVATRFNEAEHNIEVTITDNGPGLPQGVAKNVFQPFFTTKPNGLGLGLSLSNRIVTRCGGSLEFDSVEGKGTTVTIRLPAAGKSGA